MSFNKYPYTDFHEMNDDWVIAKVKELIAAWAETKADWEQVQSDWSDEQQAFADLKAFCENYFADLDVQTEINNKLDAMALDGTLGDLISPYVTAYAAEHLPTEVTTWLSAHVDPETGYVLDDSLTIEGAAADAKASGDRITSLEVSQDDLLKSYKVNFNLVWEDGGLNPSTGAEISSGRHRTGFIPIDKINNYIFLIDGTTYSVQVFFYDNTKSFLNATEFYRNFAFNKSLGNTGNAYVRFTYDAANASAPTAYKFVPLQYDTDRRDPHSVITDFKPKYRLGTNGTDVSEGTADITGLIDVHGYDFVSLNISNNVHIINTFDQNGSFLRGFSLSSGTKTFKLLRTDYYIKVTLLSADYTDLNIAIYKNSVVKNTLSTFMKFGVCGDSLSVGMTGTSQRNIHYSWGQNLARMLGNKCLNFGYAGVTVKTWQTNAKCLPLLQDSDNLCQCYIVGLGANNDLSIGTIADVNISDPSQNADSFYGNLGKDISAIRTAAPSAIIFMLTLPYPRYDSDKNIAIKEIAAKFGNTNKVYIVDIADGYDDLWKSLTLTSEYFSDHFSPIGYHKIAEIINDAISNVMEFYSTDYWMEYIFNIPYGTNDIIE